MYSHIHRSNISSFGLVAFEAAAISLTAIPVMSAPSDRVFSVTGITN
jgi:hypothetical protein